MVETVAVYSFSKFDFNSGKTSVSRVKGTLEAIANVAEGKPIMSTEEFVDISLLDGDGLYRHS